MGIGTRNVSYNRNRHTKREAQATEPMLAVMRFDDETGKPIAVLVNFAAHPTMIDAIVLKFSADYPGAMKKKVEGEFGDALRVHARRVGRLERQSPPGRGGAMKPELRTGQRTG